MMLPVPRKVQDLRDRGRVLQSSMDRFSPTISDLYPVWSRVLGTLHRRPSMLSLS